MGNLHFTFAGFALLFVALAAIAIWSRKKALWRITALGLVALILPLGYFAYIDLPAKPKPMRMEFRQLGETEVISVVLKEKEAIYLWLSVADEPRHGARVANGHARRKGTGVSMRLQELVEGAFEDSQEIRPARKSYALPYPAPPENQRAVESPK